MEKLQKIEGVYYTQNKDLPIEQRVFVTQGIVGSVSDYRIATSKEIEEWKELQKKQEEEIIP